ncbi:DUF3006 domain-containing protein [Candidatus Woesearchaeota archaeon]|nr:DUF3006 domain-containing protein [Candidatus Woesearchaeota archaeon]
MSFLKYLAVVVSGFSLAACLCQEPKQYFDLMEIYDDRHLESIGRGCGCIDRIEGTIAHLITEDYYSVFFDFRVVRLDRYYREGDCLDMVCSPEGIRLFYDEKKTMSLKSDIEHLIDKLKARE